MLRKVRAEDAAGICQIYNYYVENTLVTFEEEPVAESSMLQRILTLTAKFPWLVYEVDGTLLGTSLFSFPFY
jgi:L-amino acid N-acyltransferase YncA